MNPQTFSFLGYASVLLSLSVPLLWLLHRLVRPRRYWCHVALGVALVALGAAKLNSHFHVNRIQLDRSEEQAEWQARQEAARKAAEESRSGDVAQIRFAEDARGDFLDTAGMDESDLKYFEKINEGEEPPWKKKQQERTGGGGEDDDLESMIGGRTESDGMATETLDEVEESAPLMMVAAERELALKLDKANLWTARTLQWLALIVVVVDYLRRANRYEDAYAPLPLPGHWLEAFTPMPAMWTRPAPPRRSLPQELEWLCRRGDAFVYFGSEKVPRGTVRVTADITDAFVFEAVWYRRGSFLVDDPERAVQLLERFLALMAERNTTRARTRNPVHLVVDAPEVRNALEALPRLETLARRTGFSVMICNGDNA